jgi:hypothetical protein
LLLPPAQASRVAIHYQTNGSVCAPAIEPFHLAVQPLDDRIDQCFVVFDGTFE